MDTSNPHNSRLSSDSTENAVQLHKEKVEHLKLVIHKLQDELQTQKIRKEGTETVSRLFQESKQESVNLKKKNRAYESVIRNLQSRLENHGISSEITLQEGEQYLPGHSKQLLDNLTRENARLRNLIRNESGDPEELLRLQRQCQELEKERDELKTVVGEQKNRTVWLDNQIKASDNDKDVTIANLKEEIERMQHELSTRNSLCFTLTEETQQLQKQLKDVAEQCQELARKLKEQTLTGSSAITVTEVKQTDNKLTSDETETLQKKLKEITEMNMRWQDYNKQRDAYVKKLQQEVQEMTKKSTGGTMLSQDIHIQMNRVLDETKRDVNKANNERDKAKRDMETATRHISALNTELQQLRHRLGTSHGNESAETIEALKAQIQICTEDFESERKDREKAQTRLAKQETEMEQLRRENEALKRAVVQRTPSSANEYADPFFHYHGAQQGYGSEGLAARGSSKKEDVRPRRHIDKYNVIDGAQVQPDGDDINTKHCDDNDVISSHITERINTENDKDKQTDENYVSLRTSSLSSSGKDYCSRSMSNSPRQSGASSPTCDVTRTELRDSDCNTNNRSSEILKCPKCGKEFNSDEHFDLLEHIEVCCE